MKLPQGPAAFGATIRPEVSTQKPNSAQQSSASSQSAGDDAARVVLSGANPETQRSAATVAAQPTKAIPTSRQNALGAYAKSAANPFAATVAAFKAPTQETAPQPAPAQPASTQAPAFQAGAVAPQVARQAPQAQPAPQPTQPGVQRPVPVFQTAPRATPQQQSVAPTSTARLAKQIDDDDFESAKPTVDPQIQALAVRYVDNYTRQTGKQLNAQERTKMTEDVAKFYGAPSRAGRLEALVSTQEDVGAGA